MGLTWDDPDGIRVRPDGKFPAALIPGATPEGPEGPEGRPDAPHPGPRRVAGGDAEADRTGFLIDPPPMRGGDRPDRPDRRWVGKGIGRIGEAGGVNVKAGSHPTAHDLRRSFCSRWARQVLPRQLRTLARHARVTTTLEYHAEADAGMTAEAVACAVARRDGRRTGIPPPMRKSLTFPLTSGGRAGAAVTGPRRNPRPDYSL